MKTRLKQMITIFVISLLFIGYASETGYSVSQPDSSGMDHDSLVPVNPGAEELSDLEKKADEYLTRIKKEADAAYDDCMTYGIADWDDDTIRNLELYEFCRKMPKGGELHAHEATFIPFDRYLDVIRNETRICLQEGEYYGVLYAADNQDIPEDTVPLNEALDSGSVTKEELRSILVLSQEDEEAGFWSELGRSFVRIRGLNTNRDLIMRIYEEEFRYACETGVLLLELRVSCKPDDQLNTDVLTVIRDAYYHVRAEVPDFRVRVIGCGGKSEKYTVENSCDALRSVIRLSRELKDEYDPENPEQFIIGLDLVNEEDTGKPLEVYNDFLQSEEVTSSGLKLFLHCGESLRIDNESVIDAYLDNSARVGHGFNLYRFPDLKQKYKESGIILEVCPMSNLRLGYEHDLRHHPGLIYLRNDVPIVIASDDGLFMTPEPFTDDFYAATLCWDLSIADLKAICRRSISGSGLSDAENDRLMKAWEADWNQFIEEITADQGNV